MKSLVFVIDMVNGFVDSGAMSDSKIATITPNIKEQIEHANGVHFICDNHDKDDLEMKVYPPHCLANTEECKVVNTLREFADFKNTTFKKSTNGFFNLDKKLLENYDEFVITGCCTDICVLQFALSLRAYLNEKNMDKDVIVPKSCVETFDAPNHERAYYNEIAFNLMRNAGIAVI